MAKFSIILPVKNGGEYVKACIKSILSQTINDFNLIILDNHSTDGTLEYIQALNDHRIELHPSPQPLTIEENWGRILTTNKNELITLIGHDDILFPGYLHEMTTLIEAHPEASLYQAHFTYINGEGELIRKCKPMQPIEDGPSFLATFLQNKIDIMGTGFMMRSQDYNRLGGIPAYPNLLFADFELWLNLADITFKATSSKECFSFRIHKGTTVISPDIKFQQAFERFVYFLISLKSRSLLFNEILQNYSIGFLSYYCRGLSHRLLRTPKNSREGLTVKKFLKKCRHYAYLLTGKNSFTPALVPSILLAQILDSNPMGRFLFLAFKRIRNKPLLK